VLVMRRRARYPGNHEHLVRCPKLGTTYIAEFEIALHLAVAALFASAIGFERELREEPAGLRTHMLTALAAAIYDANLRDLPRDPQP
jgi:hypothetical protein